MTEVNSPYIEIYILFGIAAIIFVILVVFGLAFFIDDFSKELSRLNDEIQRTQGREKRYYIRQRRRLWLSLLPFVRY